MQTNSRVLIVSSNPEIIEGLPRSLSTAYKVDYVTSVSASFILAKKNKYNAVLIDIDCLVDSQADIIQHFKNNYPTAQLIIMYEEDTAGQATSFLKKGADYLGV